VSLIKPQRCVAGFRHTLWLPMASHIDCALNIFSFPYVMEARGEQLDLFFYWRNWSDGSFSEIEKKSKAPNEK
jgi:hypothetical protein